MGGIVDTALVVDAQNAAPSPSTPRRAQRNPDAEGFIPVADNDGMSLKPREHLHKRCAALDPA